MLRSNIHSSKMLERSFVIIGDIYCDIIATAITEMPKWGEDRRAQAISIMAGGSALNMTVHGAAFLKYRKDLITVSSPPQSELSSLRLKLLSCTGNDLQGEICRNELNKYASVDTTGVVIRNDVSTGTCIVLSGPGDRSFVSHSACIGDTLSLDLFNNKTSNNNTAAPTSLEEHIRDMKHFHFAGFYNCTRLAAEILPFLKQINQGIHSSNHSINSSYFGVTTSLNPQFDATGKYDHIQELCPYLTFFIANEYELRAVSKLSPESNLAEQAAVLLGWGCQAVVATLGKRGAISFFKESSEFKEILEKSGLDLDVQVVTVGDTAVCSLTQRCAVVEKVADTTGAGDAFTGAFLVEWCESRDLRYCMRAGSVAGAAAVTLVGGSSTSQKALSDADLEMTTLEGEKISPSSSSYTSYENSEIGSSKEANLSGADVEKKARHL